MWSDVHKLDHEVFNHFWFPEWRRTNSNYRWKTCAFFRLYVIHFLTNWKGLVYIKHHAHLPLIYLFVIKGSVYVTYIGDQQTLTSQSYHHEEIVPFITWFKVHMFTFARLGEHCVAMKCTGTHSVSTNCIENQALPTELSYVSVYYKHSELEGLAILLGIRNPTSGRVEWCKNMKIRTLL